MPGELPTNLEGLDLDDDQIIFLGTDDDIELTYDSDNDRFKVRKNNTKGTFRINRFNTIDHLDGAIHVATAEDNFANRGNTNHALGLATVDGVSDGGKSQINYTGPNAAILFAIERNDGVAAIFELDAVNDVATEIADPSGGWTTTEDNDTTHNVYWDSTNTQWEINNESGDQSDYSFYIFAG